MKTKRKKVIKVRHILLVISDYLNNICSACKCCYFHAVGFSNLIDLWVIKIKKAIDLCACSMSTSTDYQTWQTFTQAILLKQGPAL